MTDNETSNKYLTNCIHNQVCQGAYNCQTKCQYFEERLQGEWIPVSERLPDIEKRCIVQLTDGHIAIGSYLGIDKWVLKELSVRYSYPTKCVIAWQPLPEPYQEGGVI